MAYAAVGTFAAMPGRGRRASPSVCPGSEGFPSARSLFQCDHDCLRCGFRWICVVTWLWILIGVVVIAGVVILVVVGRREGRYIGRRSVVVGGWLSGAVDAYEQGVALHQAAGAASRPDAVAAEGADARWADLQLRADDLAARLHALRDTAPEVEDKGRVNDALGSLQVLRSAIDDERARGGGDPGPREAIEASLAAFEASLRRLRSPEQHLW
jgi:hypothetical protein